MRATRIPSFLSAAAIACAVLAAPAAPAEDAAAAKPSAHAIIDADGNGKVERAEYFNYTVAQVMAYDVDDDGRLSKSELSHPRDAVRFERADADGDGYLSVDEVVAWSGQDFSALDADGDGALTPAETAKGAEG